MTKLPGERTWDVSNPRTEDVSDFGRAVEEAEKLPPTQALKDLMRSTTPDLDALIERLEDQYHIDANPIHMEAAAALTALLDAAQRDGEIKNEEIASLKAEAKNYADLYMDRCDPRRLEVVRNAVIAAIEEREEGKAAWDVVSEVAKECHVMRDDVQRQVRSLLERGDVVLGPGLKLKRSVVKERP